MNLVQVEREKYEDIWAYDSYKDHSEGMMNVPRFLTHIEPRPGQSIIDIGCGQGNAGLELQKHGLRTWWLDITDAGLMPEVDRTRFIQAPIWSDWKRPRGWDYGFCCDVMEHIPPEFVMLCAERIIKNCGTTWFQICNLNENFGDAIDKTLHLTVRQFTWWKERLGMLGTIVDARDLCGVCMFVVKR